MMRKTLTVLALSGLLALGGCSLLRERFRSDSGGLAAGGTTKLIPEQVTNAAADGATTRVFAADDSATATSGAAGPADALGAQRIVYFDYDSSDIRPEFVEVVAAHGRFLGANTRIRVRLEGHTDERGSPEYNIGLGERRAQALRRALLLQGVADAQIATLSYGEERPAVAGSDENAYAKNRRVEIVYIN